LIRHRLGRRLAQSGHRVLHLVRSKLARDLKQVAEHLSGEPERLFRRRLIDGFIRGMCSDVSDLADAIQDLSKLLRYQPFVDELLDALHERLLVHAVSSCSSFEGLA
jgi:hypothetical protein